MSESIQVSILLAVSTEELFNAWLNSAAHSAFTGSPAHVDPRVGGKFDAWDGYISGTTLIIEPPHHIVQAWRTTEFAAEDPDSRLELLFEPVNTGTRLTMNHTEIPDGQGESYKRGWFDFYVTPMTERYGALES